MEGLRVNARLKIHEGRLEEFKAAAQACVESVREHDTATLQYEWFFNDDETECVVLERYGNSDGLLQHIANLGEKLGALTAASDISIEIFGAPSEQLLTAIEGLEVTTYGYFQGL